ncbi:MAG TPA: discoidin domain-containing protein [Cyclobacteriaceae bacterium]
MKRRIVLLASFIFQATITNAQQGVSTQHNDLNRTGWYTNEKILNTNNVRMGSFGKLFSRPVDDQIYAQPLVILNLPIAGANRNVVYVPTVNNTVYAFDADAPATTTPYWQVNLTPPDSRPVLNTDMTGACDGFYRDYSGHIGIVGTPVIDTLTHTMYLVARSRNNTTGVYQQFLHALDITTGAERPGSPVEISAQVNGNGDGNNAGVIQFDPLKQNQRAALMLLNGVVYISWASHCTWGPYHGWLIGYDKSTLQQSIVYCTTPNGKEGGIWMAGGGPAADAAGNIYLAVGNGTPGYNGNISDVVNRGESALKLTPSNGTLTVSSWFSPHDAERLVASDLDLGVTGLLLIPNSDRAFTGSKDGKLYLLDRNNMGGFAADHDTNLQVIDLGSTAHLRSSFGYYKGQTNEYIFSWSENGLLRAFPYNRSTGLIDMTTALSSGVQGPVGNNGAFLSVSSNGSDDASGILWASHAADGDANQSTRPGILHAFAANDITRELWNSSQYASDTPGNYAKFSCPTIANGKVYLASFSNALVVYGLTGKNVALNCTGANLALNKTTTASSTESPSFPGSNAVDADTTTRWSSIAGDGEYLYVDLGQRMDLCGIKIKWESALGGAFQIQVSDDAVTWQTLVTINGNTSPNTNLPIQGTGRYIKMQGVRQATGFGYSIYDMQVYGEPSGACPTPTNVHSTNVYQTSATMSWDANGLSSFNVQYKTVSAQTWQSQTVNTNSLTLTTLGCASDYFFKVQGVCNGNATGNFSAVVSFSTLGCNVDCPPLPTRWNSQDIGNINYAGSACYSNGVFTLTASGNDIWDYSDAFRYTYRTITGDGEILVRVVSMDNTDVWNKAGIMIRETLAPGSRHAIAFISSGSGAAFQYRPATDGLTKEEHTEPGINMPYWVKLVKAGSTYTASISPDGIQWTQMGKSIDVGFGSGVPVYAGIALTSHNINKLTTATIDSYLYSGLLDIDLQQFRATMSTSNTVDLEWITTLENNIQSFTVERSVDNLHYLDIDTVAAKNNGTIMATYTAEDKKPPAGNVYYRLRISDKAGLFSYSAPVTIGSIVAAVADQGQLLPVVYPNPSQDGNIFVKKGIETIRMITLFDPAGKPVIHTEGSIEDLTEIPVRMMANGMYVVEIRTEKGIYRDKVVIRN